MLHPHDLASPTAGITRPTAKHRAGIGEKSVGTAAGGAKPRPCDSALRRGRPAFFTDLLSAVCPAVRAMRSANAAATTPPTTRTIRPVGQLDSADRESRMFRFVQRLIAFRKDQPSLCTRDLNDAIRAAAQKSSGRTRLNSTGFDDPQARALACNIEGRRARGSHVMMNMFGNHRVRMPPALGRAPSKRSNQSPDLR